jgi:CelD/BcsL family acetyltransferase involved in cellulose biosynthesis
MSYSDAARPADGVAGIGRPAPRTAIAQDAFATDLIRTREAFEAISTDWAALETRAQGATLFQSAGWARAVFRFEAARGNPDFAPAIVALRHEGELVGILSLELVGSRVRRALVPLGDSFAQYSDVLLDPGLDPKPAFARMLRSAIAATRPDFVQFLKVREGSALAAGLPRTAVETGSGEGAPFVTLEGHADFAELLQTVKPKSRKNMRNARNRLEREGPLEHRVAKTADETLGIITRTLEGRAERLRTQGLTSRAFRTGDFAQFCASLADCEDGPELLAMSLRHKGEPIAEQWGFVQSGRYYAYVASRDFSQSDESPGKLHLKEVLETCFARGLKAADLLVPVMPYKLTWASGVVPVSDYALPVSLKGWAAIHLWDRTLRPLAKRTILNLPQGVRTRVMKVLGRA